jgi:23S rRNA (cytidine1920-2'-O)/16S rRNA (cytidine1409-2'-O)-methyltransferase
LRADQLLVERGLAVSRSQAVRLIAGGMRWRDGAEWRVVGKNRDDIPADAELELLDNAEARYVSRGGLKLEGALAATGIDARGRRCLDVGQSTGGFTDCLLQQGAAQVVGIDVGHDQLHARIRDDARVTAVEGVNARALTPADWGVEPGSDDPGFGLIVGDLSFISKTLVLPALAPLLAPGGDLLMLVKPQFELQPVDIGKGGLVKSEASYPRVEQRIREACAGQRLAVRDYFASPIDGGDGNREFFVWAQPAPQGT